MKMINKLALLSMITSTALFGEITTDRLGLHLGYGTIAYDKSDKQGTIDMEKPETSFFPAIEIFGTFNGVLKNQTLKPFVSYTYLSNDDFKQHYLLAGINKYYPNNNLTYYAGAYTGISSLKWQYDPLKTAKDKEPTSNALILGVQGGLEYPLKDNLSLDLNFKGMYHNHQTDLEPSSDISSEVTSDYSTFVGIGLVYAFGEEKRKEAPKPIQETTKEETKKPVQETVVSEDKTVVKVVEDKAEKTKEEVQLVHSQKLINLNKNNIIAKPILFEYDKDSLDISMIKLTQENIDNIKVLANGKQIILEGNADERGSDEYNYALGLKRAQSVKKQLVDSGFEENKIITKSYGESNPVCRESVESCWKQNRRVDYIIY
jgi:peptidoglycan-associated lipoprotein